MKFNKKHILFSALCLYLFTTISVFKGCSPPTEKANLTDAKSLVPDAYVGSNTCKTCHSEAYADWQKSDHFLAMQEAADSTVLGDFDQSEFNADGVNYKFFKKDGRFFINMQSNKGKNEDFEVRYTFGHFPLQQYLVELPGGRMQATRVSWDSRENKWFHQYPHEELYHKDWLHWTGNAQNWNTMCASCHSTDLKKNYDFETDSYQTTWAEINVSCESCHGPGNKHIDFVKSEAYTKGEGTKLRNWGLRYATDSSSITQLNTCAHCHSRKAEISEEKLNSSEIMDDLIPQVISTEFYHADGQIDDEDYVYGSFIQSKMFHNNVRCSNCHNPHSGKLILAGNSLCVSCHDPKYDSEAHTFHALGLKSSECISCHMPATTYMGNDHRRDHSFRVPRPDLSVKYGTPNACTSCHEDKTDQWAATAIENWYGSERAYHFSDDLVPGSQLNEQSEAHLIKLVKDTTQPEIARATAAYYLSNIITESSLEALLGSINDKKAMVRYNAIRSLANFPVDSWQSRAYGALTDKVRAVRIAGAQLYHPIAEGLPTNVQADYAAADRENQKYLKEQTDFAVGNVMMADYKMQSGEEIEAIRYYLRGLQKDSLMNYARQNLSAAYNRVGKNDEALKTITEAIAIDPSNSHLYYNLALLYYELGKNTEAMQNFSKATELGSTNARLYYNYGLMLLQLGELEKAEKILLKGYNLSPYDESLIYALAYYYMQQQQVNSAKKYIEMLYQLNPNNPNYQSLFQQLAN